jgi:hypothetical protein
MGINRSVQQFVARLNDFQPLPFAFSGRKSQQLDQDEITEFLDHAKALHPDQYEAMFNAKI